jgi:hypothetical protein
MSEFKNIFDNLIAERGGRQNLSVTHLSVIRTLAVALSTDPPASPQTIAGLGALLPEPKAAGAPTYDLSLLDDRELRLLEHLTALAAGEKRGKYKPERHSRRALCALDLARLLDRIEANHRELTEADKNEVRNRIHFVLGRSVDPNALYSYLVPKPAAAAAVVEPEPESSSAPAAPVENVISLPTPRQSVHDGQKLAGHNEPWRGAIKPNLT